VKALGIHPSRAAEAYRERMLLQLIYLLAVVAWFAGFWRVFEKCGRPGWEGIIPIYNVWILTTEIAKKDLLWFVLMLIPCVNFYAGYVVGQPIAKGFGKTDGFAIGLGVLPFIFYPILGFGQDRWQGSSAPPAV
jgi:hypothetical protein